MHVCESTLVLPCLLLSDATSNFVSWATRGPCYVFFFFLSFLSSQETRTNCCAVAIGVGEVCFPSTFIPGTSPSTVTVETRATLTLFLSMSPSFNDLTLLSFFTPPHSTYLPTLWQPMNCWEHGVTSVKRNGIKAEMRRSRFAG